MDNEGNQPPEVETRIFGGLRDNFDKLRVKPRQPVINPIGRITMPGPGPVRVVNRKKRQLEYLIGFGTGLLDMLEDSVEDID